MADVVIILIPHLLNSHVTPLLRHRVSYKCVRFKKKEKRKKKSARACVREFVRATILPRRAGGRTSTYVIPAASDKLAITRRIIELQRE